jgi:hypothetical protein
VARVQALTEEVAMKNQHVLHLIFAFTALHLAVCRPNRKEHYTTTADYHYERALALVTPEIASLSPSNCDAVLQSVQLVNTLLLASMEDRTGWSCFVEFVQH